MSNDSKQRELYEMRANSLRDKISALNAAERKGQQMGEKNKAVEIARNLLDVLDNETISVKTGLSMNEVEELRKSK